MQNKKITNEERMNRLKTRKTLWYLIIVFGVLTIVLSICSLVFKISPIFGLCCFLIEACLTKWRNSIKFDE